ncbi:MAG: hypothetical protein RMN53_05985 [Anaerolineae bacterium]|nr:hypothetical protein [Anaerolineae bacterium]
MYDIVLTLHSLVRWIILGVGLAAVITAWIGWRRGHRWTPRDDRLGLGFTTAMDLNLLLGLLLYFVLSPLTTNALRDFASAMRDSYLRFFAVEHIGVMVVAVVLAHIGRSRSKRAAEASQKFKQAAIFYTLAIVAVLAAIPWPFLAVGSGRGWL